LTLAGIRTQVGVESGRSDLVASNGLDYFIQAGSRYLDLTTEHIRSYSKHLVDLAAGDYFKEITLLRAVHTVEVFESTDGRSELTKLSYAEFRAKFPTALASADRARPSYYCAPISHLSDGVGTKDVDYTLDYEDVIFTTPELKSGILFSAPADKLYTLTITGKFWSKVLTGSTDVNFWSENYPELLVHASMYAMEKSYRNTAGMKDAENAMLPLKMGIEFDLVEQSIVGQNQMVG